MERTDRPIDLQPDDVDIVFRAGQLESLQLLESGRKKLELAAAVEARRVIAALVVQCGEEIDPNVYRLVLSDRALHVARGPEATLEIVRLNGFADTLIVKT